jgi:glutathione peroxidase-family protein
MNNSKDNNGKFNFSTMTTIYDFQVKTLNGKPFDINSLKDKVVLIVNTASKCGFTPQYAGLEELYRKYKDKGLVILGFPCNQFGGQEPGDAEEIGEFCVKNYGVSFPICEKIDVNGDHEYPLYGYLKKEKPGMLGLTRIKWNYEKFIVGKDGKVRSRFSSISTPESLESTIESLLKE